MLNSMVLVVQLSELIQTNSTEILKKLKAGPDLFLLQTRNLVLPSQELIANVWETPQAADL